MACPGGVSSAAAPASHKPKEVPEANDQGQTRAEALEDLAASIQSVFAYRRDQALARTAPGAEKTTVLVG